MNECDCVGHGICDGPVYKLVGGEIRRCHRHIVLHDLWCATPPFCDLFDWLDGLEGDDAQEMFDAHKEAVTSRYWEKDER